MLCVHTKCYGHDCPMTQHVYKVCEIESLKHSRHTDSIDNFMM